MPIRDIAAEPAMLGSLCGVVSKPYVKLLVGWALNHRRHGNDIILGAVDQLQCLFCVFCEGTALMFQTSNH